MTAFPAIFMLEVLPLFALVRFKPVTTTRACAAAREPTLHFVNTHELTVLQAVRVFHHLFQVTAGWLGSGVFDRPQQGEITGATLGARRLDPSHSAGSLNRQHSFQAFVDVLYL